MQIGNTIMVNTGINLYQTIYYAANNLPTEAFGVVTSETLALAAVASGGIGEIIGESEFSFRINWNKGDSWKAWYKKRYIEQSFHVIS